MCPSFHTKNNPVVISCQLMFFFIVQRYSQGCFGVNIDYLADQFQLSKTGHAL